VNQVEGKLSLDAVDRSCYQQCSVGKCGKCGYSNDEGGHLIAASLGGAGEKINIVPQASTLNRGDWRAMENEFRDALKQGKNVTVKLESPRVRR
jgi:filamentous hemagglutinin